MRRDAPPTRRTSHIYCNIYSAYRRNPLLIEGDFLNYCDGL